MQRFLITLCIALWTCPNAFAQLNLMLSVPHGRSQTSATFTYQPGLTREKTWGQNAVHPCIGGIETIYYTHAQHPEKPSRRYLNEDINGRGNRCFFSEPKSPFKSYFIIAGLPNSQGENAFFFGQGNLFELPSAYGLTAYIGEEHAFLHYELRSGRKARQGIIPTVFLGFKYQLNRSWSIGMFKQWLPIGGAKMFGTTFQTPLVGSPAGLALDERNQTAPFPEMVPAPRPSLVLSYTF